MSIETIVEALEEEAKLRFQLAVSLIRKLQ